MDRKYHAVFLVNGKRTVQDVYAFCIADAKKLIEAQYKGNTIIFLSKLILKNLLNFKEIARKLIRQA